MYTADVTKNKKYSKTHIVDGMSYVDIKPAKPATQKSNQKIRAKK